MESFEVALLSDVDTASPWQLAQEAQTALSLTQNDSAALQRLFNRYQKLSCAMNGYEALSRDFTRSARSEIMHFLERHPYLRMPEGVRISELHEELRVVMQVRRELADALLLEDVQELLHAHLDRERDCEAVVDPLAARHIRGKIARLLTDVGIPLIQAVDLEE